MRKIIVKTLRYKRAPRKTERDMCMRKTIPVLSTIALMGCNTDPNTIEVATRLTTLNQKHTTLAKSLIAELTREPEAVRIRHLRGYKAANGHQIICGEANAKNAPCARRSSLTTRWMPNPTCVIIPSIFTHR